MKSPGVFANVRGFINIPDAEFLAISAVPMTQREYVLKFYLVLVVTKQLDLALLLRNQNFNYYLFNN